MEPAEPKMRIAVLGVGLIGGSIGLAGRERLAAEVTGFDPDRKTLELALERGALTHAASSVAEAVAGADVIFCAAPVNSLPELVAEAIGAAPEGAVISDVGSTKAALIGEVAGLAGSSRFIGGHPLAGSETAGVENSSADLFEGARWYLTPTGRSEGVSFDRLHSLLIELGARPQAIDPEAHDRLMATISHLPHVLANALASRASATLLEGERRPELGPSFRDATRVAGANPGIWGEIFAANAVAVADEVEAVAASLNEAAALLREGDAERLREWQSQASVDRHRLLDAGLAGGEMIELRIAVANTPGVVAEIALALGHAGVNIEDMSLAPSVDNRSGSISLWVAGQAEADRTAEIVAGLGHRAATVSGGP